MWTNQKIELYRRVYEDLRVGNTTPRKLLLRRWKSNEARKIALVAIHTHEEVDAMYADLDTLRTVEV